MFGMILKSKSHRNMKPFFGAPDIRYTRVGCASVVHGSSGMTINSRFFLYILAGLGAPGFHRPGILKRFACIKREAKREVFGRVARRVSCILLC